MSETPVVIVPRKGVYVGDGEDHHHDWHRHRHSFHNCTNLLLRLLTAGCTLCAIILMLKAPTQQETPYGPVTVGWKQYPAYRWFIIVNAVVFAYSMLAAIVACASVILRRGPLSYSGSSFLNLVLDFLAACGTCCGATTALVVVLIGRNGQYTGAETWPSFCGQWSRFCDYTQGAIIASFIGFAFLGLSNFLDASALHWAGRRHHRH